MSKHITPGVRGSFKASELVIGGANKLAEVLEQVLGLKKCKKSFEKFGLEGLER